MVASYPVKIQPVMNVERYDVHNSKTSTLEKPYETESSDDETAGPHTRSIDRVNIFTCEAHVQHSTQYMSTDSQNETVNL